MTPLAAAPSGTAGPLGFLVVVLIGVAMVLLIRNMNSRLRKLPPSFEEPAVAPEEERPEP